MTSYLEYQFTIHPIEEGRAMLIAVLDTYDFESFVETDSGLTGYVLDKKESLNFEEHPFFKNPDIKISWTFKKVEPQNWNEVWEKDFKPITVENRIHIRAGFHPVSDLEYDIEITPKMSFGTGHHETTYMMLSHELDIDFKGKRVLDMGCGTGVLGIFAHLKGAEEVIGIDIEEWAVENSKENAKNNDAYSMKVFRGDATLLTEMGEFEIILANINRNILLRDLPIYVSHLSKKGQIILSGFYKEDLESIDKVCNDLLLKHEKIKERNNWIAVKYVI